MKRYIVACIHDWNILNFNELIKNKEPNQFLLITNKSELTLKKIKEINPEYIFFPHWSWIVPDEIVLNYKCVCFHMTDLPFGRGGSPLQNLISRGINNTKLTSLKMSPELDAGPIYYKMDLDLSGSAKEIFKRASDLTFLMIEKIIKHNPTPKNQVGNITTFERRTPSMSEIPKDLTTLKEIYDFLRMLDAPNYPHAFVNYGHFRIEFNNTQLIENEITGSFKLLKKQDLKK